ncbi:MAG: DUF1565 domain-containing protein [Myxococcales bacterium]|nr:DUF1565 domain-containing protein [Myxococcales bacterium]
MKTKTILVLAAFGIGASALAGCPSTFSVCDEGPCGTADGSTPETGPGPDVSIPDAGKDGDPVPTGCDTPTAPAKNPEKCLTDEFGAYVAPNGNDANPGTKAQPYKTIGKALESARTRIVVCEGDYAGSVEVKRGVEVYGGVSCDFTKAGGKAKIVSSKAAYGVKVEKVSDAVVLADVEVVGANGATPSESSVGVFVTESGNVKVLRSRIEAGDGADAPAKRDGNYTFPADAALKGANGDDKGNGTVTDDTGGAGGSTGACPGGGTSSGGKGGDFGFQGVDGAPRPPGGAKGGVGDCSAMGGGFSGDPGSAGTLQPGASRVATLSATGLVGSGGEAGGNGGPGGAGGGGYGFSGAGGGGGAGGCGGQGGFGGGAGGSSVALASFASTVTLEGTELVAKVAKPGGAGGSGQTGQNGGARGVGSNLACNGGNGAKGGDGGAGGGGAGGVAAGIVWSGKEPTKDAATKVTRPAGPAPAGGMGGAGASNKGVDGTHADVFEVK